MPQEVELVRVAINGFTKEWATFIQGITGKDQIPGWDQLWAYLTQEEMPLALVKSSFGGNKKRSKSVKEEENVALASKGKAKKGPSQGQGS